jgi:hypothetical protein
MVLFSAGPGHSCAFLHYVVELGAIIKQDNALEAVEERTGERVRGD